jgi:hypothetical protein
VAGMHNPAGADEAFAIPSDAMQQRRLMRDLGQRRCVF